MPNGEQALEQDREGEDIAEESGEWQSPKDDNEEESDESHDEEVVDSPPRTERRSKQLQDPAGRRGKTVAPSTQAHKCTRTLTLEPTEKVAKQPKVAPSKSRKTLPRSRWTFLLPLGECSIFLRFLLLTHTSALTERFINFSVLQLLRPPWISTRPRVMRRLMTRLLPKLVCSCHLNFVFVDRIICRLYPYGALCCSPARHR